MDRKLQDAICVEGSAGRTTEKRATTDSSSLGSVGRQGEARGQGSPFVVLNEDVCLDDQFYEFFVRGRVVSSQVETPECLSFVFTPEAASLENKGVILAHSMVKVEEEFIPVRVVKLECGRVVLKKGTKWAL